MNAQTGAPNRGACNWRYSIAILAAVLCAAILSFGDAAYPAQKRNVKLFQDKTRGLLKRGYVELSGEDAVNFLVGNTIVIKKTDTPKGIASVDFDSRYFLSDRHTAYDCSGIDCSTQFWKVDGQEICVEIPQRCDDPDYRFYDAPRLFKSPRPNERTGPIGIYLEYKSIIHAVVKGNATIAPLIDPGGMGTMIEVNSSEFSQEIEASSKFAGGNKKVPIVGPRVISFLIGNTFISGETAPNGHGGVHSCPDQGYYYSPDGRIITFNCHHEPDWPESWSMHVTHWKLASGKLCTEDLSGDGKFGCGHNEGVYLTASDEPNKWVVSIEEYPRKIVGYSGNVYHFK